jgi:Catechol dioxygenase N terminus/Dioxygenase
MTALTPSRLTDEVVASYKNCSDPRLQEIMISLVKRLHSFAREVKLTEAEWLKGVEFLTQVGQFCTETRQEFIPLSDVLGLEMTVIELNHGTANGATEATLLVMPKGYQIPSDGPVSGLMRLTGRSLWRPAHLHFMISAKGYKVPLLASNVPLPRRIRSFWTRVYGRC